MTVHFIGAGPGAPDLLTLRGARLIGECPVCVYAGSLVPAEVLGHAPAGARLVDTQHLSLDQIVEELQRRARARRRRRAPALGRPLDLQRAGRADAPARRARHPVGRHARRAGVRRGRGGRAQRADAAGGRPDGHPHPALARVDRDARRRAARRRSPRTGRRSCCTSRCRRSTRSSRRSRRTTAPDCPAVVVARASWPDELILTGTLATIAGAVRDAGVRRTAVVMVGRALAATGFRESHLYSPARERPAAP